MKQSINISEELTTYEINRKENRERRNRNKDRDIDRRNKRNIKRSARYG